MNSSNRLNKFFTVVSELIFCRYPWTNQTFPVKLAPGASLTNLILYLELNPSLYRAVYPDERSIALGVQSIMIFCLELFTLMRDL